MKISNNYNEGNFSNAYKSRICLILCMKVSLCLSYKRNRAFADFRFGKEDSISPRTLHFATEKG